MFDFDVLEKKEVWAWVDGKFVERASEEEAGGEAKTEEEAAKEEAERRAAFLRGAVRSKVKNRDPPPYVLQRWEQCEPAKDLLRHFVLEDAIGVGESIKLREVMNLLDALTWSSAKITAFFLGEDAAVGETDELARELLRVFAGMDRDGDDSMRFRGVFRLLEVLDLSINLFMEQLSEVAYSEEREPPNTLQVGNYRMVRGIGSGFNGMCIYRGEHISTGRCVAVKWPVGREELEVLKDIGRQSPPWFLGLPELMAHGTYGGKPYVVTELLGSPLTKVLDRLEGRPLEARWRAMRLLGRLVLRRLEALHGCGYVHCDISPENILLGLPRQGRTSKEKAPAPGALTPYLIDFGLAQKHPGGMPLEADHGSAEWSSVRSAAGACRRPEDDLEALGWLMVNGLFGDLPWFDLLGKAYKTWDLSRSHRARAIRKVQEFKLQLLNDGWGSLGDEWLRLATIPPALDRYMHTCRSDRATGMRPDYAMLSELLGGREGLSLFDAENEDLKLLQDTLDRL